MCCDSIGNSVITQAQNGKYTYCSPRTSIPLTFTFFFACAVTICFIFLPQVTLLIIHLFNCIPIKLATENLPSLDTITTVCRTLNNKARANLSQLKQQPSNFL